tara:strand:- start:55 stop:354 length:300 start_codon:yes stop_codon:yes gene_type:complete
MQKIREELQEMEDEQMDGYQLKTNEEVIDIISYFGNGETEFHTIDINRLVVENDRAKRLIELFEASKTFHELPNDTTAEYNEGYVKAMCNAINRLKEIF